MADEQKTKTITVTLQTYNTIMEILNRLVVTPALLAFSELKRLEQEEQTQSQVKVDEQGD